MSQTINPELGQRIRALRAKEGLSREQLAELAGITPTFLYKIESGEQSFTVMILAKLARYLQTSSDYILYGEINCQTERELAHVMRNLPEQKRRNLIQIFSGICSQIMP